MNGKGKYITEGKEGVVGPIYGNDAEGERVQLGDDVKEQGIVLNIHTGGIVGAVVIPEIPVQVQNKGIIHGQGGIG